MQVAPEYLKKKKVYEYKCPPQLKRNTYKVNQQETQANFSTPNHYGAPAV